MEGGGELGSIVIVSKITLCLVLASLIIGSSAVVFVQLIACGERERERVCKRECA